MATIIAHPQHGKMFVYTQAEIDRHAELGWAVWNPPVAKAVIEAETHEPITEQPRRRGRPRKA